MEASVRLARPTIRARINGTAARHGTGKPECDLKMVTPRTSQKLQNLRPDDMARACAHRTMWTEWSPGNRRGA